MKTTTAVPRKSRPASSAGFVKIRRGLREHLDRMSSNAVKLYVWLHLAAFWGGPKRGVVETSYPVIAEELGWNLRMVKRTVSELREKGYIEVAGARNQYETSAIRIVNYDAKESLFARDKGVPSKVSARDTGVHSSVTSSVTSKRNISRQVNKLTPRKKSEESIRSTAAYGKRSPQSENDAGLPPSPALQPTKKNGKERLEKRLAAKIAEDDDSVKSHLEHCRSREDCEGWLSDCWPKLVSALGSTGFPVEVDDPSLCMTFLETAHEVVEENDGRNLTQGILCTKVIDRCREKIARGEPAYWPPKFEEHRDRLRAEERKLEVKV